MNESEINTNAVFFLFFEKFFQQKKKHWNFRVGRKKKIFEVRYEWFQWLLLRHVNSEQK
jgi:hypothetical protein